MDADRAAALAHCASLPPRLSVHAHNLFESRKSSQNNDSVQSSRSQAQIDAGALGFPVILYGSTIRIPRLGFIYFMRYGRTSVQKRSYK